MCVDILLGPFYGLAITRRAAASGCLCPGRGSVLGRETGVIVFDGFAGFDIDALGAVGGSIRGGGLLLHPLILPSVSARPEFLVAGSVIETDESGERQHSYKKSSCPLQPQGQHHRHHPYSAQQLPPVLYWENTKI
jgi:hypothetical protein